MKKKTRKRTTTRKALDSPPKDKMVREPERKKEIWELLADRERSIHG